MKEPDVIDAAYRVLEPPHEWRIRFWPSVLFWLYVTGCVGAAEQILPVVDRAEVVGVVLMAAIAGPSVRCFLAIRSALTGRVDAEAAQLERSRRLGLAR